MAERFPIDEIVNSTLGEIDAIAPQSVIRVIDFDEPATPGEFMAVYAASRLTVNEGEDDQAALRATGGWVQATYGKIRDPKHAIVPFLVDTDDNPQGRNLTELPAGTPALVVVPIDDDNRVVPVLIAVDGDTLRWTARREITGVAYIDGGYDGRSTHPQLGLHVEDQDTDQTPRQALVQAHIESGRNRARSLGVLGCGDQNPLSE